MSGASISAEAVAEAVGPGLGAGVVSGAAALLPITVPGAAAAVVWLVKDDSLPHPLQAYVGRWPGGDVRVLSDDQDAWAELMTAVGVLIDDPATALGYVRQFLEITRGTTVLVREVAALTDVPWRPGSAAEEARRAAFLSETSIPEPVAERVDHVFHVELTLVVDQRVQRNLFDVTADGRINASFQVLAEDLPLPIIR